MTRVPGVPQSRKSPGWYYNPPPPIIATELELERARASPAREVKDHAELIALADAHFRIPYQSAPIVVYRCHAAVLARVAIQLHGGGCETTATCPFCGMEIEAMWILLSAADVTALDFETAR